MFAIAFENTRSFDFFDKRNRIFRKRIFADLTVYTSDRATDVSALILTALLASMQKLAVPCVNSCVSGIWRRLRDDRGAKQLLRRTFTLERTWTISRRRRWIVPKHCRQVRSNLSPALIRKQGDSPFMPAFNDQFDNSRGP